MDGSSKQRSHRRQNPPKNMPVTSSGRVDFQKVFAQGRRVRGGEINVIFLQRSDNGKTHWGIAIGRKYGTAVKRNRIRRVAREELRACAREYPLGYDLVLEILTKGNLLGLRELRDRMRQVLLKSQALLAKT